MGVFKRRKWLVLIVLVVLVAGGWAAAGKLGRNDDSAPAAKKSDPSTTDGVAVTAEPVTLRPIRRTVTAVGSLWGWEEVPITPKVEGRVIRVHKFVGDVVKPGDLLLEIDPTDYQLAVNEAEKALELELAKLNLTAPPADDFDLAKLPSVVRAAAVEKQAKARATRLRSGPRTSITDEEQERADGDVEIARANIRQAELEARATLAAARHRQAALKSAQQRLADSKITAPRQTLRSIPVSRLRPSM